MRVFAQRVLVVVFLLVLGACTKTGETTTVATATGAAIGAGLGAIVGSQTGSTGAGVALGALAGTSAGVLVGSALETQEKKIETQNEEIQRQKRTLEAQQREIAEMRNGAGDLRHGRVVGRTAKVEVVTRGAVVRDSTHYADDSERMRAAYARARALRESDPCPACAKVLAHASGDRLSAERRQTVHLLAKKRSAAPASLLAKRVIRRGDSRMEKELRIAAIQPASRGAIVSKGSAALPPLPMRGAVAPKEGDVEISTAQVADAAVMESVDSGATKPEVIAQVVESDIATSRGSFDWSKKVEGEVEAVTEGVVSDDGDGSDCSQAAAEIKKGQGVSESSERLFHYRRALRLCPGKAEYHSLLGQLYQQLNRPTDAAYEYKEALTIDPSMSTAREALATLAGPTTRE